MVLFIIVGRILFFFDVDLLGIIDVGVGLLILGGWILDGGFGIIDVGVGVMVGFFFVGGVEMGVIGDGVVFGGIGVGGVVGVGVLFRSVFLECRNVIEVGNVGSGGERLLLFMLINFNVVIVVSFVGIIFVSVFFDNVNVFSDVRFVSDGEIFLVNLVLFNMIDVMFLVVVL